MNFILDNRITGGKATPMIVVMDSGGGGAAFAGGARGARGAAAGKDLTERSGRNQCPGRGYGSVEGGANDLKSHHGSLVAAGITTMSCSISPGTAHEWLTWRCSFHEFVPLLFKN